MRCVCCARADEGLGLSIGKEVRVDVLGDRHLVVEAGIPVDVRSALSRRGHTVKAWRRFTAVQAITRTPAGQAGAADPSKLGAAVPAR